MESNVPSSESWDHPKRTHAELVCRLLSYLPTTVDITEEFATADSLELKILIQSANVLLEHGQNSDAASLSPSDAIGARFRLEALKNKTYERINTGHWSAVSTDVRKTFTLATFMSVVYALLAADNHNNDDDLIQCLVHRLDNGILLGCPLAPPNHQLLTAAINLIGSSNVQPPTKPSDSLLSANSMRPHDDGMFAGNVPILQCPSLEQFQLQQFNPQLPAILTGCMDQWPAMTSWCDVGYLMRCAGNRSVPIEIGANYTHSEWSQDLVRFGDFVQRHFGHVAGDDAERIAAPPTAVEYLAQHNLFDQIPDLRKDLIVPEYCCLTATTAASDDTAEAPQTPNVDIRAWLGPADTVSPAHTDPKHNLLAQVFGEKQILLAAPDDSANLYPHANAMLQNTSQVDAEHVDAVRFPLASRVRWQRTRLYRGEMLYIPPGWWHHVRALSKSFSVSFWNILVLMESVVSGHQLSMVRERLADKIELTRFDPYIQRMSLYKERRRVRSL